MSERQSSASDTRDAGDTAHAAALKYAQNKRKGVKVSP